MGNQRSGSIFFTFGKYELLKLGLIFRLANGKLVNSLIPWFNFHPTHCIYVFEHCHSPLLQIILSRTSALTSMQRLLRTIPDALSLGPFTGFCVLLNRYSLNVLVYLCSGQFWNDIVLE